MKPDLKIESKLLLFIKINVMLNLLSKDLIWVQRMRAILQNMEYEDVREGLADSIGRSLHNIYSCMESILEKIAMEIDGSKPAGESFQIELLDR